VVSSAALVSSSRTAGRGIEAPQNDGVKYINAASKIEIDASRRFMFYTGLT
jgi:hypothetical protein